VLKSFSTPLRLRLHLLHSVYKARFLSGMICNFWHVARLLLVRSRPVREALPSGRVVRVVGVQRILRRGRRRPQTTCHFSRETRRKTLSTVTRAPLVRRPIRVRQKVLQLVTSLLPTQRHYHFSTCTSVFGLKRSVKSSLIVRIHRLSRNGNHSRITRCWTP